MREKSDNGTEIGLVLKIITLSCSPGVIRSNNMDLKALFLIQGVTVAMFWSTFVAALELAPEPSVSSRSASSSSSSLCSRALATTLWGAAFAFFSLLADSWPASKARLSFMSRNSLLEKLNLLLFLAPVAPLFSISVISRNWFTTVRFRQIHGSSTYPELGPDTTCMFIRRVIDNIRVIWFGAYQQTGFLKRTRIVANTYVGLGIRLSTNLPPSAHVKRYNQVNRNNVLDALTLGEKTDENSFLIELTEDGKLALLESSILPSNKQLRFLDGRSGIATLILSIQAIGYVASTVYRTILHLPVSPIEAIGFAYSMLVIVLSVVRNEATLCQNSLVIYLNPTQEQELLDICESTRWSEVDEAACKLAGLLGAALVGIMAMASILLVQWHVFKQLFFDHDNLDARLNAIGPLIFFAFLVTQAIDVRPFTPADLGHHVYFACVIVNFVGIVVSIVETIVNWKTYQFDSRTPSMILIWPFLG